MGQRRSNQFRALLNQKLCHDLSPHVTLTRQRCWRVVAVTMCPFLSKPGGLHGFDEFQYLLFLRKDENSTYDVVRVFLDLCGLV